MTNNELNKGNTIFIDRYKYVDTKDLLNEILKRTEIFNKVNGYHAGNIKMAVNMYYDILNFNKTLIKKVDKNYYILCMKVVL